MRSVRCARDTQGASGAACAAFLEPGVAHADSREFKRLAFAACSTKLVLGSGSALRVDGEGLDAGMLAEG